MDLMMIPAKEACPAWVCPALAALVLTLYAAFPTRNYYWDGVSFALAIESPDPLSGLFLHPNHLIYNGIGYVLWSRLRAFGFDLRALVVLQTLSIIAAVLSVWVLHRLLLRITNSAYVATSLAALFAFSSTWWKFATDADAYILGTLALIVAAYLTYASIRTAPRPHWVSARLGDACPSARRNFLCAGSVAHLPKVWPSHHAPIRRNRRKHNVIRVLWRLLAVPRELESCRVWTMVNKPLP